MYRTWVIVWHTFREAVTQPIYALLIAVGAVILWQLGNLPFFTFGEDTLMYKSVGLDVVLLVSLLLGLIAASRTVHEEVEDRTMLTLMSKPVGRGQVLLGKFLGLLLSTGLAVGLVGVVLAWSTWVRVPTDFRLPAQPVQTAVVERLSTLRSQQLAGLWPQLVLTWMQVGVLVAIATAISTRFGIVVTLPATLLLYIAGNLTRFIDVAADGAGPIGTIAAAIAGGVLPFLRVFDLTDLTVFGTIALPGTDLAATGNVTTVTKLWAYVGVAFIYFVAYVAFVLGLATALFRRRDLGGGEG
jgi:ABC-type transport system involved in multi-copper enzyme maturation permease subunit